MLIVILDQPVNLKRFMRIFFQTKISHSYINIFLSINTFWFKLIPIYFTDAIKCEAFF